MENVTSYNSQEQKEKKELVIVNSQKGDHFSKVDILEL
jgi:hypothetical protein